MKKIIYSTIVLTAFSLSLILFQISCQDDALAENNDIKSSNRFLYAHYDDNSNTTEYWTANMDGTDSKKIPITLPGGLSLSDYSGKLTPDGQTLIFSVRDEHRVSYIYSVSVDGSNLKKIIDGTGKTGDGIVYEVLQTY